MSESTPSKEDLIAKAWERWWEADYSWEGLAQKEWRDGKTLQDYWLTDPESGQLRAIEDLRENGELIARTGYPEFHICHLPFRYADGLQTRKYNDPKAVQEKMDAIVHTRLNAAYAEANEVENLTSHTARLEGTVWRELDLSKNSFNAPLNLTLDNVIIIGDASFGRAIFLGIASFDSANFSGKVNFDRATFSGPASFDSANFSGHTIFEVTTFSSSAHFNQATFTDYISFDRATFKGSADFYGTTFTSYADFEGTAFFGVASFDNVTFSSVAKLDATTFSGDARFNRALFSNVASFDNANFSGVASLQGTTFSGDATFNRATFSGNTFFSDATFSGDAIYDRATFKKNLSFARGVFFKRSVFKYLTWPDDRTHHQRAFLDAIFKELANFGGSGFRTFAAFDGARFQNGLRFDKTSKADDDGKKVDFETRARRTFDRELKACKAVEDETKREQHLESLEAGCRTLKNEMIKQGDKGREQLLYKFELLARREQTSTHWAEKIFSHAYDLLSDYGGSAARPLAWLAGVVLAFTFIHATFLVSWPPPLVPPPSGAYTNRTESAQCAAAIQFPVKLNDIAPTAFSVSLSRVFPFGGFEDVSKRLATAYDCHGLSGRALGFRIWATLESLLAIILAFLFGLAVRRRFQIS